MRTVRLVPLIDARCDHAVFTLLPFANCVPPLLAEQGAQLCQAVVIG
ncbi:MAG TPA: hypothetical protein VMK12_01480 [Anaeromyxobacteraceae bacterium]|nr:hypothetical protein [Anaeromyxobacteraceae bacterium]